MKVLVVGNGAREHTIAWKLAASPRIEKLYCAPGNAGTAALGENVPLQASAIKALAQWAKQTDIDLTVIGPEAPLAAGIVDEFETVGLRVFGPSRAAAMIESSKAWTKDLLLRYQIPAAKSRVFSAAGQARAYLQSQSLPVVIKADGLAAGKGVVIASTYQQAEEAITSFLEAHTLGEAGQTILIEEYLTGPEVSLLAFTDGETVLPMVPACDYKRIGDGDRGPNTGGMGAYSPPGFVDGDMIDRIVDSIIKPTVAAMAHEGRPYKGVLYAGIMLTPGGPKILEYNCRFGDPETQVILPRLTSDLLEVMEAAVDEELAEIDLRWSPVACCGVVLASGGYPGNYRTGYPIHGLNEVEPGIEVFHAGTQLRDRDNVREVVTAGGRVLTVVATGGYLREARDKVYQNVPRISFQDCQYRTDIAAREIE